MKLEDAIELTGKWIHSGAGNQADSYYNAEDNTLMLKLYFEKVNTESIISEVDMSKAVSEAGVPTPGAATLVRSGNRYGLIFRRIPNKLSFCSAVAKDPSCLENRALRLASMTRDLHSKSSVGTPFCSVVDRYSSMVASLKLDPEIEKTASISLDILHSQERKTLVHGDFHFGNVITDGKEDYFIDLGCFGYGNPDIDNSLFFCICNMVPEDRIMIDYHITKKQAVKFWEIYSSAYYGKQEPMIERFSPYILLRTLAIEYESGPNPFNDSLKLMCVKYI